MAGLGTYFVALMGIAVLLLWRKMLFHTRWVLWLLLLSFPLPYIANTAGWLTAEVGRQPWLVYGLLRTSDGYSKYVSTGQQLVHLARVHGTVQRSFCAVYCAGVSRNLKWTWRAPMHAGQTELPITMA